jgi:hypothetical protein
MTMDYEVIRAARLCRPFRPFFLRTLDGQIFFIREDVHVAVSPTVVAVYDEAQNNRALLKPSDVDGLLYADQPLGAVTNGN